MLFDALINLFKTICLAAIAFSPLLVYKALDQPAEQNYIVNAPSLGSDLNTAFNPAGSKNEDPIFGNSAANQNTTQAFGNSSPFGGTFAPPPPPSPPVDAPLDSGLYFLLLFGLGYGFYKHYFKSRWILNTKKNRTKI